MPFYLQKLYEKLALQLKTEKFWFSYFAVLLLFTGLTRYITHSEFWSIFYSKYLFLPGDFQDSLYSKLIFHSSLAWLHWLPFDNLEHILAVKVLFSAIAGGILYLSYRFLSLKLPRQLAFFFLAILYFNPIVFWDIPQAKADILCLLMMLLTTAAYFQQRYRLSLLLIVGTLLTTPKSILFLPFLLLPAIREKKWSIDFTFRKKLWLIRGVIVLIMFVFWGQISKNFFLNSYAMAWTFAKALFTQSVQIGFFTDQNNFFVNDMIRFLLPTLVLALFYFFGHRIFTISKKNIVLFLIYCLYSVALIVIYPLKHPYFLIPIVFLLVLILVYLVQFDRVRYQNVFVSSRIRVLIILLFSWQLTGIVLVTKINWGVPQFAVIKHLQTIASINPAAQIADGMGILPRANVLPQFIGFSDPVADKYFFSDVASKKPDLLIITPRVRVQITRLQNLIDTDYVYLAPNILVRKVELSFSDQLTSADILENLNTIFKFPIHIVSFRSFLQVKTSALVLAQCLDTNQEKADWEIEEFKSCRAFKFKDSRGDYLTKVVPVPYPAYLHTQDIILFDYLNFKNFAL